MFRVSTRAPGLNTTATCISQLFGSKVCVYDRVSITHPFLGCRYVSRALAQGLHHNKALRRESASVKYIMALLALAFPGQLPRPSSPDGTTELEYEATQTARSDQCVRATEHGYQETRENAISCLCSVSQVNERSFHGNR